MSPLTIVLSIVFIASLQCVGAADGEEVEVSQQDYDNVVVSFWKDRVLCIGTLIRSTWVLITHECHRMLQQFHGFYSLFGGFTRENLFPKIDVISVVNIHSQSKYIILILNRDVELSSSLKLSCKDTEESGIFTGVLLGWDNQNKPAVRKTRFQCQYQRLKACDLLPTYDPVFPSGSIVVEGTNIIGFIHYINSVPSLIKVGIADELKIQILMRVANGPDRMDSSEVDDISIQDYHNIIVSFWKMGLDELKLICIGVLVNLKLVITTLKCVMAMPEFSEIIVSIEGYNNSTDKIWPKIARKEAVRAQSRFFFLFLDRTIELSPSIKFGCAEICVNNQEKAQLVGWNEQGLERKNITLEKRKRWKLNLFEGANFLEGSIVLMERAIVAVASFESNKISLLKVTFEDFVAIETKIRSLDRLSEKTDPCEAGSSKPPKLEKQ